MPRPYVRYNKFQPLTGEAVRIAHGLALAFGCRGFGYDKWRDNLEKPFAADSLDASERATLHGKTIFPSVEAAVTNITGSPAYKYYPGYVVEDSLSLAWDHDTTVSADSLFRYGLRGGDYLLDDDPYVIDSWVSLDSVAKYMQVERFIADTARQGIYVGRRSVPAETRWWHDLVTDADTTFRYGTDQSNAQIFMRTRPVGWFGKGFKTLTNGDVARLRQWVDAYADSLKVFRWTRSSATDTTLVMEKEPPGEQLYDVVLLDISLSDTAKDDDTCVIAITNRRTSPLLLNNSLADSVEFLSSYDFDTLTRGSRPDLRYKQAGARRIRLPFRYTVETSQPYLLHVRELRPAYDSLYTIDTVLNWNSGLVADFRPGETRYFKVSRLPATDTLASGYLAYSTQNKMILYPVRRTAGSGYGDSVRYHMVFHRRDTDPSRPGPWTVYYQRSKPYHRDSLPRVADLLWETPYRLSKLTTSSTPSTDGLKRTRYGSIDSNQYEAAVPDSTDASRDCCCGFPSIVVREVAADTPKVFVVYACEDMWAMPENRGNYFHIVENAFLDQPVLNAAALEANGKSLLIAGKDIGHDVPADNLPPIEDYLADTLGSLAKYGTPVVAAAAEGRMYYAWSSVGSGIGGATKHAGSDYLPNQQAITHVPTPVITWYNSHDDTTEAVAIPGGAALYPSLSVYSNLSQNSTSATLVWEEGTSNRHIRYTRLVPGIGTDIARDLPIFRTMRYTTDTSSQIAADYGNKIAIVGGASPEEEPELPVVVRSLQPDVMSMWIRDTAGGINGLYYYNHETVAWGEYLPGSLRTRVRYNHFVDMTGSGVNELHYWWANTTGSTGPASLFHPVLTQGIVRLDSLVWEGIVGDSLITYADSLKVVRGNVSDSALIVNYTILGSDYAALRVNKTSSYASYWTGQGQLSTLQGQQIAIARMPGVPAPPQVTYHYDYLRADGAWPHLAQRWREDKTAGFGSVRRLMQYTADDAPSLVGSAEQFYKPDATATGGQHAAAAYGGYDIGGRRAGLRAAFSDGTTLTFRPAVTATLPKGFAGSHAYALQMASMSNPPGDLLSEAFTVGEARQMKILTTGRLRKDLTLTIEEVPATAIVTGKDGRAAYVDMKASAAGVALTLGEADSAKPEKAAKAAFTLARGRGKLYRLRLTYNGDEEVIYRHDIDLDPEKESFAREAAMPVHVVDLSAQTATAIEEGRGLLAYPNPSAGTITVIMAGHGSDAKVQPLQMEVVTALGVVIERRPIAYGIPEIITGLPTGTYAIRITAQDSTVTPLATAHVVVIR